MLDLRGAKIQVLDTPGLIEGAHIGKGAGNKVASVIRVVDLMIFVVDVTDYSSFFGLLDELKELGVEFGERVDKVRVDIHEKGGIHIVRNSKRAPSDEDIVAILNEFGIFNANVTIFQSCNLDEIVDVIAENKVKIKSVVALNKIDLVSDYSQAKKEIRSRTGMDVVPVSAKAQMGMEPLKDALFENLDIMRVFLKEKGGRVDFNKPLIVRKNSTVIDVAKKIHADMAKEIKYANITGVSVKFANQKVGLSHVIMDSDIVTFGY
jgi:ribosome-interacting GTPase 1